MRDEPPTSVVGVTWGRWGSSEASSDADRHEVARGGGGVRAGDRRDRRGDPTAGDAAEDEFATWLADHPVAGYQPEVRGPNDLPFTGSLSVVMAASDSDLAQARFGEEIAGVAAQVCSFEPEASVGVKYAFAVGDFSVPMTCPGESDAAARVDDQASLLSDLMAVRRVESTKTGAQEAARALGNVLRAAQ